MQNPAKKEVVERASDGFLEHIVWTGPELEVPVGDKKFVVVDGTVGTIVQAGQRAESILGLDPDLGENELRVLFEGALLTNIPRDSSWRPFCFPATKEVREKLSLSLQELLSKDEALFLSDANERTISGRLGLHLQKQFADWHVDCEYNRAMHPSGPIASSPKRLAFWVIEQNNYAKQHGLKLRQCFPDIIVHRRESCCNLLVLEMKKYRDGGESYRSSRRVDLGKLRAFRDQLGYKEAVFLSIITGKEPAVKETRWLSAPIMKPGGPLCYVQFPQGDRQFFAAGDGPSNVIKRKSGIETLRQESCDDDGDAL